VLIALNDYFVHRMKGMEKKDGNPLNEVRILCDSIMNNHYIMGSDNTIKYDPAKSILKYKVGDEIKLNENDFKLISVAFFA
jgi:dihydroxyacetone kinase